MAVPKRKTTPSKRGQRRSHDTIKFGITKSRMNYKCPNCGASGYMHHVCKNCGMYKGMQILEKKVKVVKEDEA
jgi:large subunit ribosomal protein L32